MFEKETFWQLHKHSWSNNLAKSLHLYGLNLTHKGPKTKESFCKQHKNEASSRSTRSTGSSVG